MRFRREALEAAEAPEDRNESVAYASVPAWLMSVVLFLALSGITTWVFLGTVSSTLTARGYLVPSGGISILDAARSAKVTNALITPGEFVDSDQPLYELSSSRGSREIITAPWPAQVVGALVKPGEEVRPGDPLVELARHGSKGERVQAVAYIPASQALLIRPNMTAQVSTAAGHYNLMGRVSFVGVSIETQASLRGLLGATVDIRSLLAAGPVVAVRIDLAPDQGGQPLTALRAPVKIGFTVLEEHPVNWLVGKWA